MLAVQIKVGAEVVRVESVEKFLGAQICPSAMYVEEAVVRFNARAQAAEMPERAVMIRTLH
jgi:hypothetical protein